VVTYAPSAPACCEQYAWSVQAGDPIGYQVIRYTAAGVRRSIADRLRLVIYGPDRVIIETAVAEIVQYEGGDMARAVMPGGTSEALRGKRGLSWQWEAEREADWERQDGGPLSITDGPARGEAGGIGQPGLQLVKEWSETL